MRRKRIVASALAVLAVAAPHGAQAQPDMTAIEEQIVTVRAFDGTRVALGDSSGLAVGGGRVVTSAQMLRGAETIVVVAIGGEEEYPATVLSSDERSGVAILEAEGLETAAPSFARDDPDADPDVDDLVYVPRFAAGGGLEAEFAVGLIAEVRPAPPMTTGDRELLLYRHNARVRAREYGMPMLNWCGEVTGIIRPDPDLSLRQINLRADPGESTFGVASAEVRRALADVETEVETAAEACAGSQDTIAVLEAEAQRLEEAAEAVAAERDEAREAAEAAQARAAELEADNTATQEERDAAREEAEKLQAAAAEREAELDDLEQREAAARTQAEELRQRIEELERRQLVYQIGGATLAAALLATVLIARSRLRRRKREMEEADEARRDAEERQRQSEQELAAAVKPASFSVLLEGADDQGRDVAVKIEAAQLGVSTGVVVGRNPAQAGVLLDHAEASREHLRLTADGNDLFIEDLRSTNGTFVNGGRLAAGQRARLSGGDEVGVGEAIRLRVKMNPDKT